MSCVGHATNLNVVPVTKVTVVTVNASSRPEIDMACWSAAFARTVVTQGGCETNTAERPE